MSDADLKMVVAMLEIISDSARERNEEKTAGQIDKVIDTLRQKQKEDPPKSST